MIKLNEIQAKYGEYLVDEDKLKELLVKPKQKTVRDLEEGDIYYYLNDKGQVCESVYAPCSRDYNRIAHCNAFLTYEEAKFEAERKKCEDIMLKYGRRTFKINTSNFCICYNHLFENVQLDDYTYYQIQGNIYFDSDKLAQKAIDEIGIERLKKYIFRVEK